MKIIAIVALGLLAAGCAARSDGVQVPIMSNYCQIAQPVRVSRADTRLTKEQADREYRKYVAACGMAPPA